MSKPFPARNPRTSVRLVAFLSTSLVLSNVASETSSNTYPVVADSNLSVALGIDIANLARAAGSTNSTGSAPARSFTVQLRKRLPNLQERFEIVLGARQDTNENDFRVHGVMPTTQYRNGHVVMCFSESGKALGAWKIYLAPVTYSDATGNPTASFSAGQIDPQPVTPTAPDQIARGKSPCYGTMMTGIAEIKSDHMLAQNPISTPK